MAILKIARMGHPVLLQRAAPVPDPTAPEVRRLVADMIETMEDAGGAGLAAPQVHVPLRLFVFRVPAARTQPGEDGPVPTTVVINPELELLGDEMVMRWEGCLSIPDLTFECRRALSVVATGFDLHGEPVRVEGSDVLARALQHETDHLDGVLFVDRLDPQRRRAAMKAIRETEWGGGAPPPVKFSPHAGTFSGSVFGVSKGR